MPTFQIKRAGNYYIDQSGKVFTIEKGAEVEIKAIKSKNTKRYLVYLNGKPYDYLNLMLEYFAPEIKTTDKVRYKINKLNRIESSSIVIKPFVYSEMPKEDELKMHEYGCNVKAGSANQRCTEQLTPIQIFTSLKIHEYKCVYCAKPLHSNNWHLDHYIPLSKGGKNKFENIVPSCPKCNLMKHTMHGEEFYIRCKKIVENFMFKSSVN